MTTMQTGASRRPIAVLRESHAVLAPGMLLLIAWLIPSQSVGAALADLEVVLLRASDLDNPTEPRIRYYRAVVANVGGAPSNRTWFRFYMSYRFAQGAYAKLGPLQGICDPRTDWGCFRGEEFLGANACNLIGERVLSALKPGESETFVQCVFCPSSEGICFFSAVADALDSVHEANEENNTAITQLGSAKGFSSLAIWWPDDAEVTPCELTHPDMTGWPEYGDTVDRLAALPTLEYEDVEVLNDPVKAIERTWVVADTRGNTESHVQRITVLDKDPPRWLEEPDTGQDTTAWVDGAVFDMGVMECWELEFFSFPTEGEGEHYLHAVTDDCPGVRDVHVTAIEEAGDCPESKTVSVVWVASDYSGNTSTVTQAYHIVDSAPPVCHSSPDIIEFETSPPGGTSCNRTRKRRILGRLAPKCRNAANGALGLPAIVVEARWKRRYSEIRRHALERIRSVPETPNAVRV